MALSEMQGKTVPVKLWAPLEEVESEALDQLKNVAALPWVRHHVAAMPDVHFGKGATVGSVIAMKDALAPSAVGVDIGCGMFAFKTTLKASDLPDNLDDIRAAVEAAIPVGFSAHEGLARPNFPNYKRFTDTLFDGYSKLNAHNLTNRLSLQKTRSQLGSLGGGNHFIELCLDTGELCRNPDNGCGNGCNGWHEQNVWLMLHSGSRNVGKEVAEAHIYVAKHLEHNARLPDPDLAVFLADTPEMKAYRADLMWAQGYAFANRQVMAALYFDVLRKFFPNIETTFEVNCHHNYVAEEQHFGEDLLVTRKGAISAKKDEYGIIPGSMGTQSYIVQGLGNAESFMSASHGAGRRMSRGKAKRTFTEADLIAQTAGVNCRKDTGVLDEIPGAYKRIDKVMENQRDLVKVVAEIKQVMCIKG